MISFDQLNFLAESAGDHIPSYPSFISRDPVTESMLLPLLLLFIVIVHRHRPLNDLLRHGLSEKLLEFSDHNATQIDEERTEQIATATDIKKEVHGSIGFARY